MTGIKIGWSGALCLLSGTALFLGCANWDLWVLPWFGMMPWLFVILSPNTRRPFFHGWLAGLAGSAGGFYWVFGLLQRFADLPAFLAAVGFFLFIAYQALQWAAFSWALRRIHDRTRLPVTFLAPVIFVSCELLMPFLFPWYFAITQAWVRPVIQIAEWTGPLGVSFVLVLVNAALYEGLVPRLSGKPVSLKPLVSGAAVLAAVLAFGYLRIEQVETARAKAPQIAIGIVQANTSVQEKFDLKFAAAQLSLQQKLSADLDRAGADLILWPETSYPYGISRARTEDVEPTNPARIRAGFETPLLFGALTGDPTRRESPYPFNSAIMLDGDKFTGRYDKHELLLFGEYIPFVDDMAWLRQAIPMTSNYARGRGAGTIALNVPRLGEAGHVFLGPLICYEDITPSYVRQIVKLKPNLLVNMTNDAWYGDTAEPWEHLQLSVYRAVESRLDLVRADNGGISAFIDSTGKVYAHTSSLSESSPVTLRDTAALQQASGFYASFGEVFGYANLAIVLMLLAWTAIPARAQGADRSSAH